MVERRDQVRTTFFSLAAASTANLASRCVSVKGPFLTDLPISLPLLTLARHNKFIRALVVTGLVPTGRLAPWRHRMASAGSLAFTAAVRVIHWIHGYAAIMGRLAQPPRAPSFTERDVFVIDVAHLPD